MGRSTHKDTIQISGQKILAQKSWRLGDRVDWKNRMEDVLGERLDWEQETSHCGGWFASRGPQACQIHTVDNQQPMDEGVAVSGRGSAVQQQFATQTLRVHLHGLEMSVLGDMSHLRRRATENALSSSLDLQCQLKSRRR